MFKNETLAVHIQQPRSFQCSSDGKLLGCVGRNTLGREIIRIFNIRTAKQYVKDLQHKFSIIQFRFSPNNNILVSAASDHKVRLWNVRQGKYLGCVYYDLLNPESCCFSPVGIHLAYAYWDNAICICKITNRSDFKILEGHRSFVVTLCYSSKGNMLVSDSEDKSIRIWNTVTYKLIYIYQTNSININTQYALNSQLMISSSFDKIRIQDARRRKQIIRYEQGNDKLISSPDGTLVVYLSDPVNAGYPIYSLNIMTRSNSLLIPRKIEDDYYWIDLGMVQQVQFSQDGRYIIFDNNNLIRFYKIR